MNIPVYHQGSVKSTSLKEMKQRFAAPYHYTVTRKGWVCHYVSEQPSFAVAEAWLKKLTATQKLPSSWCLIDKIGDHGIFFMWVLNGVVKDAKSCIGTAIEPVIIQRAEKVFVLNDDLIKLLPSTVKAVEKIESLTEDDLKPFALKSGKGVHPRWILVGVAGLMTLFLIVMMQQPVSKEPPPIDRYIEYRQVVNNALDASAVINASAALGAYGLLLPEGWELLSIDLQERNLLLSASRNFSGKRTIIKKWLQYHSEIKPYSSVMLNTLSVSVPITESLSRWENKSVTIEPVLTNVVDSFISLGWKITSSPDLNMGEVTGDAMFEVKKDVYLHELQSIAKAIKKIPLSLSALQIKPLSAKGQFQVSLTLRLIGATT